MRLECLWRIFDIMFTVYTIEQSEEWDDVVHSFEEYDVYYLSGYVKAFHIHGDGEPLLFYYEDSSIRGINVVMKRDIAQDAHFVGRIAEDTYYDIVTPYGYGGWLIEGNGDGNESLFKAYETWLQKNRIISEFVRFHPMLQNQQACEKYYEIVRLGEVVHMSLNSPKDIWDNVTSKNRNVIRKAEKNEVKIYNGRFPKIYEVFHRIYDETMDKDNADKYYYFTNEFYESILDDLSENAQVFFAVKDAKIIAAAIILAANGKLNYHLSGSLRQYSSLAATNLLLYKVALWGYENGYSSLYLGGGVGSGEDSLFKFKRAFYKGDLNRFYIGKKIVNEEAYDFLLKLREDDIQSSYFPEYRA